MPIGDIRPGDRVGAMLGSDGKTVRFLGYGTYLGEEVPPLETTITSLLCKVSHDHKRPNPKIQLDNGDIVWGCETWWGDEEAFKRRIYQWEETGFTITTVSIHEARAAAVEREPAEDLNNQG